LGFAVSGLGLILFGLLVAFWLPERRAADDPTVGTDFSAVPVKVKLDAPSLTLTDLHGVEHSLADYTGQVVLVNLWATWCAPCAAEMPNLQAYFIGHRDEGFTVIAIEDGDPSSYVQSFALKYGLTFPIWLDPTYQAAGRAFKPMNLPSSYVIDRAGQINLMWIGAIDPKNLEKYVTPIIEE
jgi:peroxiredoxin